jgi:hypothetical protein
VLQLNILEAVVDDIISNKQIPNAIFGVNVMLLLPIMKEIQIIDCEGFKLWCVLYFIWNMKFCKNKGFGTQESFAHNFPTLIVSLLSFGYTPKRLLKNWVNIRRGSLMSFFIDRYR